VESGIGRGVGVIEGVKIVEGKAAVLAVNVGHPIVANGVIVILRREGWRRGSSQITLGFIVYFHARSSSPFPVMEMHLP